MFFPVIHLYCNSQTTSLNIEPSIKYYIIFDINTVSDVVLACCVLHHFCVFHREQYLDNWDCPQECVERPDRASAVSIRDALLTIVCRN